MWQRKTFFYNLSFPVKTATPDKGHPPLLQQPPSKNWDYVNPPFSLFWKFGKRLKQQNTRDQIFEKWNVCEHYLESWWQSLDENVTNSPIPRKWRLLARTYNKYVLENFITDVSEIKGQIEEFRKLAFHHQFSLPLLESINETFSSCICKNRVPRTLFVNCQACSMLVWC